MGFFTGTRPWVIAHRGLSLNAVENTLDAFRAALLAGATHLETDVQASRDHKAFLWHDTDLKRLTGRAVRVAELSANELGSIDLGGGSRIVTLEQALLTFPEARFNIDVKDARSAIAVVDVIRRTGSADRVLITSFSRARRRLVTDALKQVATSPAAAEAFAIVVAARLAGTKTLLRATRGFQAVQMPEFYGPLRLINPAIVRKLHRVGVDVHVWTVDDPDDMKRLLDMGVDGIVTNRTDLLSRVAHGQHRTQGP